MSHKQNCGVCSGTIVTKPIDNTTGLTTAVIDDANGKVYIYGNIQYETHHVPSEECQPYVGINIDGGSTPEPAITPWTATGDGGGANELYMHEDYLTEYHVLVFKNGLLLTDDEYAINDGVISFAEPTVEEDKLVAKYYTKEEV